MKARELVAAIAAAFRAAPTRENGAEALYSAAKLRDSLVGLIEAVDVVGEAAAAAGARGGVPRPIVELLMGRRELTYIVEAIERRVREKEGPAAILRGDVAAVGAAASAALQSAAREYTDAVRAAFGDDPENASARIETVARTWAALQTAARALPPLPPARTT
jgi:hypothetical protein